MVRGGEVGGGKVSVCEECWEGRVGWVDGGGWRSKGRGVRSKGRGREGVRKGEWGKVKGERDGRGGEGRGG